MSQLTKVHARRGYAFLCGLGLSCCFLDATAAQVARQYFSNPVALCQSALPQYDAVLRKKPTAIRNEGNETVFVSCSIPMPVGIGDGYTAIAFYLGNYAADFQNRVFSCTLVDGDAYGDGPRYYAKTQIMAYGVQNFIAWFPSEYGFTVFAPKANFSCALPAGGELKFLSANYLEQLP